MKTSTQDQSEVHGETAAGASNAQLQQLSRDLAHQDGRTEARAFDRELARREFTGTARAGQPAQEVPPGAEGLVTWDVSAEEAGHLTPDIPSEDEANDSAELAAEGRGEAEQDLRRAAEAETHLRHEAPNRD